MTTIWKYNIKIFVTKDILEILRSLSYRSNGVYYNEVLVWDLQQEIKIITSYAFFIALEKSFR